MEAILGNSMNQRYVEKMEVCDNLNWERDSNKKVKDNNIPINLLKCMYTNVRSLMNRIKRDELIIRLKENSIDILGITESWTHEGIEDAEIAIPGYNLFRRDRNIVEGGKERGGGVLLYVNENIVAYRVSEENIVNESVWVNIQTTSKCDVKIGVCYKGPNAERKEIENLYKTIREHTLKDTIIMGDFNFRDIDWKFMEGTSGEANEFMNLIDDCFLTQHVMEATRGNNILDLVLSTESGMVEDVEVKCPVDNSDHNVILFKVPVALEAKVNRQDVFSYHRADYKKIREKLKLMDWENKLKDQNIESMWQTFENELISCRDEFVPKKIIKKQKNPPWMKRRILKDIKRREKAWKEFINMPSYENKSRFKRFRNQVNNSVASAKVEFESKLADNIKEDPKSFYAYVRSKCKNRGGVGPLKDEAGVMIDNNIGMSKLLNNYFASVFTEEDVQNMPEMPASNFTKEFVKLEDIEISEEIVIKSIDRMKPNKAAGVDGLTTTFIKEIKLEVVKPMVEIFKRSMDEGQIPLEWKRANVTAIFKKGSKKDPGNYRPVSLTSNVSKIFERIIKNELVHFLEENSIIKNSQHGFRNKKSCLTNLLEFVELVAKKIDSGEPVDVIFLDFQKAFDKVPHERLLSKLKAIGISGKLLRWIREWLKNRKQRVVINGEMSEWRDVLSGVPQGSILGPLLFIIFINDIDDKIRNKILKFADDTKLISGAATVEDTEELQNDLQSLFQWSERWQMNFNLEKCKVMHLGYNNKNVNYSLGGKNLEKVTEEKDLGVLISDDFKFGNQCSKAAKKGNQILGMIKRTITCKNKKVMLNLYKSLVRPHLEYCIQAWRPHLEKDIGILERVQRRATRMIDECIGKTYQERLNMTNLTTLEERRTRADMLEVYKILNGFEGIEADKLFTRLESNTRGHSQRLVKNSFRKDIFKYSFGNRIKNLWNNLPNNVVNSTNINNFKDNIGKHLRYIRGSYES